MSTKIHTNLYLCYKEKKIWIKLNSKEMSKRLSENHADTKGNNNPFYGKKHKKETIEKFVNWHTGKKLTDDHRKNIGIASTGRLHSIDSKNKIRESNKKNGVLFYKNHIPWNKNKMGLYHHTEKSKKAIGDHTKSLWDSGFFDNRKSPKLFNTKPELKMKIILDENNVEYKFQHRLSIGIYDFYLPSLNILIEVDGAYWHGRLENKPSNIEQIIEKDKLKNNFAIQNGYKMIRVWDDEIEKIWRIIN